MPHREQLEIRGREEEKEGSRALEYSFGGPGCRNKKGSYFFLTTLK